MVQYVLQGDRLAGQALESAQDASQRREIDTGRFAAGNFVETRAAYLSRQLRVQSVDTEPLFLKKLV